MWRYTKMLVKGGIVTYRRKDHMSQLYLWLVFCQLRARTPLNVSQKYGFKSIVFYLMIFKLMENSQKNPLSCVSVVIATLTSKIKTCTAQLMFTDCVLFRTDHCPTSFTSKVFFHMVNIWTLSLHSLTFFKRGETERYCGDVAQCYQLKL